MPRKRAAEQPLLGDRARIQKDVSVFDTDSDASQVEGTVPETSGDCPSDCLYRQSNIPLPDDEISEPRDVELPDQADAAEQLYTPIHDWQTRLLVLHLGQLGEDLVAELVVVDLILAAGVVVHGVQKKRLRVNSQERNLWIDAVCINQHDVPERSIQVAVMLMIFKKAHDVEAWLGESSDQTRLAIALLNATVDEIPHYLERHDLVELAAGLRDLLSRPWHRRLWVRQEAWAARSILIRCGGQRITWKSFVAATMLLEACKGMPEEIGQAEVPEQAGLNRSDDAVILAVRNLDAAGRATTADMEAEETCNPGFADSPDHASDIVNVLRGSTLCEASDARDRIYGLLGMSRTRVAKTEGAGDEPQIEIDYLKSASEVFQDLTRYLIHRENSLSTLYLTATFGSEELGLPSWTPDWRLPTSNSPWLEEYAESMSGINTEPRNTYFNVSEAGLLKLKAFRIGTIETAIPNNWVWKMLRPGQSSASHGTLVDYREMLETGYLPLIEKGETLHHLSIDEMIELDRSNPYNYGEMRFFTSSIPKSPAVHYDGYWVTFKAARPSDIIIIPPAAAGWSFRALLIRYDPETNIYTYVGPTACISTVSQPEFFFSWHQFRGHLLTVNRQLSKALQLIISEGKLETFNIA